MKVTAGGWRVGVLALAAICGGACATQATPRDKLLKRAAFDLNCTKDELVVSKLDERTRGVRGCGRQATYVQTCDHYGMAAYNCTWVMNTAGRDRDDEAE